MAFPLSISAQEHAPAVSIGDRSQERGRADIEAPDDIFVRERFRGSAVTSPNPLVPASMRRVTGLRSGNSAYLVALGVAGGILGALAATAVSLTAALDLLSATPVYPFNPHGGVHKAPAYAIIGCLAGLLIPAGGFLAGGLIVGGIGLAATCILY